MTSNDRYEVADLIYASVNTWYRLQGRPQIFRGGPQAAELFFDIYHALEPGCAVVAEDIRTRRLMGSCFYHPRPHHVALGIMNVHPNYFGFGVARALLNHIIEFTEGRGSPALRLTQSAVNLDSFSLYNRAGFVPRHAYQDMYLEVPTNGLGQPPPCVERVRRATLDDVPHMAALEREISGVTREQDYRFCIGNSLGIWHVSVFESDRRELEGFLMSCQHPSLNMLGPGVCRTDEQALALIHCEFNANRGRTPVCLVPVERARVVQQMYAWGARNCELHFCQVREKYQPFQGINIPTFSLETA